MKGNDEIAGLFRSSLAGAEMAVRDGFWEELQSDLSKVSTGAAEASAALTAGAATDLFRQKQKRFAFTPRFYRVAAAASVVFVLGAASAAFWYFSPKEEIQEAFTKVATLTPEGSLNGDVAQEKFPSINEANSATPNAGHKHPGPASTATALAAGGEEEESVSVTVSITITQRMYGNHQQGGNGLYGQNASSEDGNGYHSAGESANSASNAHSAKTQKKVSVQAGAAAAGKRHHWAFKAGIGTSLPKGDFGMPLSAGFSAERRLSKRFSLEAGVQYNRLEADHAIHTLAVPVKLNAMLASSSKVDLYATLGGAAEKCIAGAKDNGFGAEPVQLSVAAGLGVRYKLNDRIALFAEPTVSHYFDTDSQTRTLRTERPTNFNLLCGVRMTY